MSKKSSTGFAARLAHVRRLTVRIERAAKHMKRVAEESLAMAGKAQEAADRLLAHLAQQAVLIPGSRPLFPNEISKLIVLSDVQSHEDENLAGSSVANRLLVLQATRGKITNHLREVELRSLSDWQSAIAVRDGRSRLSGCYRRIRAAWWLCLKATRESEQAAACSNCALETVNLFGMGCSPHARAIMFLTGGVYFARR